MAAVQGSSCSSMQSYFPHMHALDRLVHDAEAFPVCPSQGVFFGLMSLYLSASLLESLPVSDLAPCPPPCCLVSLFPPQEALGALAAAIKSFDGGVLLISHNSEFTSTCCSETWRVADGVVQVTKEVPPGPAN
jgi:hypothetical protein